jgi:polysaccharide export outer membrane protein
MRINTGFIVLIVFLLLLSGGVPPAYAQQVRDQAQNSIQQIDKKQRRAIAQHSRKNGFMQDYKLGPGDKLKISVYGEDKLSGIYKIDGNGDIALPLIGTLTAQGINVDALRRLIVNKLEQGYLVNPSVTIEITEFRPFYIMGEIGRPGGYEYVSGISVLNAVAISGGFTYRADRDDIIIIRKQGDSRRRLEVGPKARVMPGDTIKIQERFF